MTKVVKFSIVALIAIASIVIYSCNKDAQASKEAIQDSEVQIRTLTGLCEDAEGACASIPYTTKIYTIHGGTPSYPDGEFSIELRVRWCPPNNLDVIYVGMGYKYLDPDCYQFDLDTSDPSIVAAVVQQVAEELIRAGIIEALNEITVNPSGAIPKCGVGAALNVSLFQSACRKTCFVKPRRPTDGQYWYKIVELPCGNSCCQSVNEVCIDSVTEVVKIREIYNNTPTTPCIISGELPCPFGTEHTIPCRPACASIQQGG